MRKLSLSGLLTQLCQKKIDKWNAKYSKASSKYHQGVKRCHVFFDNGNGPKITVWRVEYFYGKLKTFFTHNLCKMWYVVQKSRQSIFNSKSVVKMSPQIWLIFIVSSPHCMTGGRWKLPRITDFSISFSTFFSCPLGWSCTIKHPVKIVRFFLVYWHHRGDQKIQQWEVGRFLWQFFGIFLTQ